MVFSIGITLLVITVLVFFLLTFTYTDLSNIATNTFQTDVPLAKYAKLPWVWALILAGLILFLFFVTQGGSPGSNESDMEQGIPK